MGLFSKKNKQAGSTPSPSTVPNTDSHLDITMTNDGAEYTFLLEGRLDTLTSPDLEGKVNETVDNATKLIFDLDKLEYISSAGLRVLLGAAQEMEGRGEMVVCHLTQPVKEIFELTGFDLLFHIE